MLCHRVSVSIFLLAGSLLEATQTPIPSIGRQVPIRHTAEQQDLFAAVLRDDTQKLEKLLSAGADINARDAVGDTPLFFALRTLKLPSFYFLLGHGADPNIANNKGETPLLEAVVNGFTQEVSALLASGAHVQVVEKAQVNNISSEILSLLKVNAPAKMREEIKQGIGAAQGKITQEADIIADVAQSYLLPDPAKNDKLLRLIARIEAQREKASEEKVQWELTHNDERQIRHIITQGANPDVPTQSGKTLLMFALEQQNYDFARFLLEAGANVNAVDGRGQDVFSYFFDRSIDVHSRERIELDRKRAVADFANLEKRRAIAMVFGKKKEGVGERKFLKRFAESSGNNKSFLERIRFLKFFIARGLKESSKHAALLTAVRYGDIYTFLALVTAGFSGLGRAMKYAVIRDNFIFVQLLLLVISEKQVPPSYKQQLRRYAHQYQAQATSNFLQALDDELLAAAQRGDKQSAYEFLQRGADPNAQDRVGNTASIYAAEHGYLTVLEALQDYGADFDMQNNDGATPLIVATIHNQPAVVTYLFEHNVKENVQDHTGKSFLAYAKMYSKGSPLGKAVQHEMHLRAFFNAITAGAIGQAKECLISDPSTIMHQHLGHTPLMAALLVRQQPMVKFLLLHGSDPNEKVTDLLRAAIRTQQGQSMQALLEAGARIGPEIPSEVVSVNSPQITQIFEAYVAFRDRILKAFRNRSKDEVMWILEQGPRYSNVSDAEGNSLLMLALKARYMKIAEYLLQHGARINMSNIQGVTPLMQAAKAGIELVVRFILEHGAAINQKDEHGWSALTYAIAHNHMALAQLLIMRGADIGVVDSDGKTLSELFVDKPEFIKYLRNLTQERAEKEHHAQEAAETARLVALRRKIDADMAQESAENPKRQKLG